MNIKKSIKKLIKKIKKFLEQPKIKKYIKTGWKFLALFALYVSGKILGIDLLNEFSDQIAAAFLFIVYTRAQKWFGIKFDFLLEEQTKGWTVEAIKWAEGKAVEKFKKDKTFILGSEKSELAINHLMAADPNLSREQALSKIEQHFAVIQPEIEKIWIDLANHIVTKNSIEKIQ